MLKYRPRAPQPGREGTFRQQSVRDGCSFSGTRRGSDGCNGCSPYRAAAPVPRWGAFHGCSTPLHPLSLHHLIRHGAFASALQVGVTGGAEAAVRFLHDGFQLVPVGGHVAVNGAFGLA